ncbi:MAG: HEPN domain-containing protein [Candidatus Hydrogenedentes bacterium]|nr:HEPN domain-containing protein [Candidatus Hydrogenedentota bacterium]
MDADATVIRYRIERARSALAEARLMYDAKRWNACVSRLYYACFYAVLALLARRGLSSSKHSGVRALFNQHFVKTGLIPAEIATIYNDLFDRRRQADYEDFFEATSDDAKQWLLDAEEFVGEIQRFLNSNARKE